MSSGGRGLRSARPRSVKEVCELRQVAPVRLDGALRQPLLEAKGAQVLR